MLEHQLMIHKKFSLIYPSLCQISKLNIITNKKLLYWTHPPSLTQYYNMIIYFSSLYLPSCRTYCNSGYIFFHIFQHSSPLSHWNRNFNFFGKTLLLHSKNYTVINDTFINECHYLTEVDVLLRSTRFIFMLLLS